MLLLPDAPDYPIARLAWNTIADDVYPQAVLQAVDARDVQQAVRFCRDHGLQPTARQGGGVGPFVRQYGLTLDSLLSAEIVTADGRLRRISPTRDADLFWAIRGGGGGNFGVVTSFEFATVPVDRPFHTQALTFPWPAAERVFEVFQTWVDQLPIHAHPGLEFITTQQGPAAHPSVEVSLWYRGNRDRSDAFVDDFVREVGLPPSSRTARHQSFFTTEFDDYCPGLTQGQCAPITRPPGQLPRVGLSTGSEISRQRWPSPAVAVLIEALETWQRDPLLQPPGIDTGLQVAKVIVEPINGAAHAVAATATAFSHRDGFLVFQIQSRLRQIKAACDPGHLFRFPQSLGPAG